MTSTPSVSERYQFKPFVGSSHAWALEKICAHHPSHAVLDIGTGRGAIGEALRAQGFTNLTGVEPDEEARRVATPIYDTLVPTLEELPVDRHFDVVLLLDVLEHTPDPDRFLQHALRHLAPTGELLISVPNIAHWSARLTLLFGFWPRMDRGIFDRTHLHFFTKASIVELCARLPGVSVTSLAGSIAPLELLVPARLRHHPLLGSAAQLRHRLVPVWPGLLAYQHLLVLQRT